MMKLPPKQRARLERLMGSQGLDLNALTEMAGLDKRLDFIRADFRNVDFGTSDLAGFNFAQADLTGADLSRTTGRDRLVLIDAIGVQDTGEMREGPGPAMVRIPAGQFTMGAKAKENRREKVPAEWAKRSSPQRDMTIPNAFWIGKYPVTRAEFEFFTAETGRELPDRAWTYEPNDKAAFDYTEREGRNWRNPGFAQTDQDPVTCVSHDDVRAYIEWLNDRTKGGYRLPSEAEWEYAARAGTETARFWGDGRDAACRFANVADAALTRAMNVAVDPKRFFPGDDGFAFTAPVGSFLPNPFGLYDMFGNVWEWCADYWTENLRGLPERGAPNATGDSGRRSLRGGSWHNDPRIVRAAHRGWAGTGLRSTITGFRVARTETLAKP